MPQDQDLEIVIGSLLGARKQLAREDLMGLAQAAKAAGGTFEGIANEPDGKCPQWRFPFPPRGTAGLSAIYEAVWRVQGGLKIVPVGVSQPESLRVVVTGLGNRF